jgi:hypothetical protein
MHAALVRISGHAVNSPEKSDHSGVIFLAQVEFLFHPVRLEGDRVYQGGLLAALQPLFNGNDIGRVE